MAFEAAFESGLYAALAASTALTSLLSGGTASPSIYNTQAPQGAAPPYVVFNQQSGNTVYTLTGVAYDDVEYQVQAITTGPSMASASAIQAAFDAVLNDGTVAASGYGVMYLRRRARVSYAETVDGQRYNHRGHVYRVMADPA